MSIRFRPSVVASALALAAAVLWGLIECFALWRSRRRERHDVALRH